MVSLYRAKTKKLFDENIWLKVCAAVLGKLIPKCQNAVKWAK